MASKTLRDMILEQKLICHLTYTTITFVSQYLIYRTYPADNFYILFGYVLGNFRNMPASLASKYQLKDFVDKDKESSIKKLDISVEDVVCVDVVNTDPLFGIVLNKEDDALTVRLLETLFDAHMHAYMIIDRLPATKILSTSSLRYMQSLSITTDYHQHEYICPRYAIC